MIRTGDVIVATTRPNLNAVAMIPPELDGQICSTGFCVLRTEPTVLLPGFLFAFVRHEMFVQSLTDLVRGALYPAVNDKQVKAQRILLPPLHEQERIMTVLDGQMAAVERARGAAESRVEAGRAMFFALVRDSLAHGGTRRFRLGQCLQEVKEGVGLNWHKFPVLGATRGGLAPAKEAVGKSPQRYKLVEAGTVFYNPMRILLGSIAMVDSCDPPGITSPDYVVIKGRDGILDGRWFYHWLRSPIGEQLISSLSRGAVRERILFPRLAKGEIEVPPYETQREASAKMVETRRVIETAEEELSAIRTLPAALTRTALSGAA